MTSKEKIKTLTQEGLLEESAEVLYDNAPCGYFSTLTDGTFVKINQTFLKWVGYDDAQLLYVRKFQDLLSVGDAIFYETHITPLLQMQGFTNEINFSIRRADGNMFPALLNSTQVKDRYGKPVLYRTTVFDITDRKKYEMELLRTKKVAEEALKVKSKFLSTVSHEIRTPMNAIVGIVNLLSETKLSPKQAEYLAILKQSSDNLLTLINDVLDFSKMEAGKVTLHVKSFHIRELIASVINNTKGNAEEKGLAFNVTIDEQIPQMLLGDPIKIRQVLTNLVGNAIKFTEKGSVAVRLKLLKQTPDALEIEFSVQDTGIGIQADQLERVFEEFTQATADISQLYGGTGLGLAISQRLLALYNSRLRVESTPGQGARFYFDLTLQPGEVLAQQRLLRPEEGAARGIKVLLAEDNNINVYVVSQYLKNWGVEFDVVSNGQEAVERVQQQPYDLILMDLQMPLLDGYEASKQIRGLGEETQRRIPIIALTASAQADYPGKLKASGIDGILTKPFDPQELYTLLASYNPSAAAFQEESNRMELAYTLATFDELMADDPSGMAELLNIVIDTLREAKGEMTAAIRACDEQRFGFWTYKLETSLELLQAKRLQAALQQAKFFFQGKTMASNQQRQMEKTIAEQFDLIIDGLEHHIT